MQLKRLLLKRIGDFVLWMPNGRFVRWIFISLLQISAATI